ncbi:MAG: hypothetical protein KAT68_07700 [Bacteroidales bacterium]|nr:hypothetical protein [Bacteroidales bacterium]
MIDDNKLLIEGLSSKINSLRKLYEGLKKENQELINKNEILNKEIEINNQECIKLNEKYNKLKLAKNILASSDDTHDAKIKLNKIVREIDNCIALLNR